MRNALFALATLALAAWAPSNAAAQNFGAAFAGFDTGSNEPIQIEADKLEVRDPEKLAIYTGHVQVRQGETLMEAPELKVFYTGDPAAAAAGGAATSGKASAAPGKAVAASSKAAGPAPPGSSVSRIEAGPKVAVRSKDQTANGDRAVLDMAQDLITMTGNVVLTQGANVVHGAKLVVNMKTKQGRMEGGRVQTLITPSSRKPAGQ